MLFGNVFIMFASGASVEGSSELLARWLRSLDATDAVWAVMYLDLDGFKAINDLHGHQFGDQLLNIVGARLLDCVRPEDMVCRMGGDEFACLLINVANTKALRGDTGFNVRNYRRAIRKFLHRNDYPPLGARQRER
jgi:diguanylate cyclase (GGDEF)-like protein